MIQHSVHLENDLKANLHYSCPGCGRSITINRPVIYEIGDVDTQQKKDIYSFAIFDHKCNFCGHRFNAMHNFTLIRNSREEDVNFILHFMSDRDIDKATRIFTNHLTELYYENDMLIEIDNFGNFINAGYPCRIVRNKFEFGEKSFIFGDGLDDRIIEVLKLMVKDRFMREHPNMREPQLFYNNRTGEEFIWRALVGNEYTTYTSPISQYRIATEVVEHSIKYWNSNQMFFVDELYAQTIMSIYNKNKNNPPAGYAKIRIKSDEVREAGEKYAQAEREKQRSFRPMPPANYPQNVTIPSSGNEYGTDSNQESSYGGGSMYVGSDNQNPGFEFKYDPNRAMTEGGSSGYEGYVTPTETLYGNSEYRPYLQNGDTVEMYHLDEGSTNMDN